MQVYGVDERDVGGKQVVGTGGPWPGYIKGIGDDIGRREGRGRATERVGRVAGN